MALGVHLCVCHRDKIKYSIVSAITLLKQPWYKCMYNTQAASYKLRTQPELLCQQHVTASCHLSWVGKLDSMLVDDAAKVHE